MLCSDRTMYEVSPSCKLSRKRWWLFVSLSIAFLLVGQTAANLLGRFYYAESGSSLFLVTLVQTAGFPMLCIPLILIPSDPKNNPVVTSDPIDKKYITLVYLCLGVLLAGDNLLFSVGAMYLPATTYSLIAASQLAFNAIFSFFLNSQKFTSMILNSVVALTISSGLLAMGNRWSTPEGVSHLEYLIGFLCTLCASAVYSLLLSLMQLSFQKVLRAGTYDVVMRMQIYTSFVATIISMAGLLASGQWRNLGTEMENFDTGPASYVMTLVWSGISWQISSIGVVGLIFLVSSLFSNVTITASVAIMPIATLIVFHDPMTGVKGFAMVLALWGFTTYLFQMYLDTKRRGTVSQTQISAADDSEIDKASSYVISLT